MTQPLNLALTLSLDDRLIGPLQKSFSQARRAFDGLERDLGNVIRAGDKTGDTLAKIGQKGKEAASAANGLRAVASAADQAEGRVSRLHVAMDKLSRLTVGGASVFAAFAAGKHILQGPMDRGQAYELSLAKLSNVLFSDRRTVAGRQAGQGELDASIRKASLQGVTREEALSGLRFMGASGGVDRNTAMNLLPTLAKFSVAGEASMEDVAAVAMKGMTTGKIPAANMKRALEKALISGQLGNFEFKDLARWLPQQMAIANGMLGMSGEDDFATLLAVNQIGARSAGGSAEAGNNIVNLLGKMNSADTVKDFARAGVDLPGRLATARGNGINQFDAFFNVLEEQFAKDKGYVSLQRKLKAAKASGDKGDEAATLEAMSGILKGSVLGKFLSDRQALTPAIGILNDRGGVERMKREFAARAGEAELSQGVLMDTSAMKNTIADSAEQARQFDALRGLNDAYADARLKIAELSVKYPEAAKYIEMMSKAAQVAAVSLAALSLGNLLGKALPAVAGTASGAAIAAGVGAGAIGAKRLAAGAFGALAANAPITMLLAAFGVGGLVGTGIHKAIEGTMASDAIGETVAKVLAAMGNQEAKDALEAGRIFKEAAETMRIAVNQMAAVAAYGDSGDEIRLRRMTRDARRN